jgi:putative NADPH-quinone reductase
MVQRIAIIQRHPDPGGNRFCHALRNAYAAGACDVGLEVRIIDVAHIGVAFLRTQVEFEQGQPPLQSSKPRTP